MKTKAEVRIPHSFKVILPSSHEGMILPHNPNVVKNARVAIRRAVLTGNEVTLEVEISVDAEIRLDVATKNFTVELKDAGEHSLM